MQWFFFRQWDAILTFSSKSKLCIRCSRSIISFSKGRFFSEGDGEIFQFVKSTCMWTKNCSWTFISSTYRYKKFILFWSHLVKKSLFILSFDQKLWQIYHGIKIFQMFVKYKNYWLQYDHIHVGFMWVDLMDLEKSQN